MGAVLAVLVLVSACSTPLAGPAGDGGTDAAPFQQPGSMTIRVRNDGNRMLYVQASGWSGQEVTAVITPDGVVGRDSCEVCNCQACPSCAVCGRALAKVTELAPGAALDFAWDQTDWTVIENGCRQTLSCEQPALVPAGPLTARAFYSDTFTTTTMFGAEESYVGPITSTDTVFQHPATEVVVVPIL